VSVTDDQGARFLHLSRLRGRSTRSAGAAAAVHRSGSGQRADAVAGAWIYPDRDQRQRQRADRTHRRIDRFVSRHPADMVVGAALADGHGARQPRGEDGV
jgi:hypothetical protein